jgi:hypothetical protein
MRLAVGADLGSIDRGQADTVDLAIQSDVDRLARDHRGQPPTPNAGFCEASGTLIGLPPGGPGCATTGL